MAEKDREELLTEEILADARKKADRICQRAEHEASKIAEAGKARDQAFLDEMLKEAHEKSVQKSSMILASIALEERRLMDRVKEGSINKILEKAVEILHHKDEYDYPALLRRLAVEALQYMGGNAFVLSVHPSDLPLLDDSFFQELWRKSREDKGKPSFTVNEDSSISGGIIVRSADGQLLYNNSFTARLKRMRDPLRREIFPVLFEHLETRKTEK